LAAAAASHGSGNCDDSAAEVLAVDWVGVVTGDEFWVDASIA
jgi:hypothetical protein